MLLLQERLRLVEARGPRAQPVRGVAARRKCQWDFVVDEMRWLANDYIEERRWKQAAAKVGREGGREGGKEGGGGRWEREGGRKGGREREVGKGGREGDATASIIKLNRASQISPVTLYTCKCLLVELNKPS